MTCFTRCILRWGLIGGLALGGVTLLVGPERVAAGFSQIRTKAQTLVDSRLSEPLALRRQLEALVDQYPARMDEVQGELKAVAIQVSQLQSEVEKDHDVVVYATDQLTRLKTLITRAESEAEATVRPVAIRFEGIRFNIDEAYSEARRFHNIRSQYEDSLAHNQQQLTFLGEQHRRLSDILEQLKSEHGSLKIQLAQLNRQIDAIERNERLIELTERQQETLESYERFGKVGNLKQLESRLAQVRAIHESQLQRLEERGRHTDIEARARQHREMRQHQNDVFDGVEIKPQNDAQPPAPTQRSASERSVALAQPIIVE
jgi:peptidoglycan hydrolase CwlO-like protein